MAKWNQDDCVIHEDAGTSWYVVRVVKAHWDPDNLYDVRCTKNVFE